MRSFRWKHSHVLSRLSFHATCKAIFSSTFTPQFMAIEDFLWLWNGVMVFNRHEKSIAVDYYCGRNPLSTLFLL